MPINVTCPGCRTRFTVGDQHAGKTGACPKCKGPITIPKLEDEVVIHAPEPEPGAKNAAGRNVLKPLKRKETKFRLNAALVVGGAVVLTAAIAFLLGNSREQIESAGWWTPLIAIGAVLLGPPLAYAGYFFLRDDELEPYRGVELLVRCLACGLVYAALWGLYWYLGYQIFGSEAYSIDGLELYQMGILLAVMIGIGTGAAVVCFDLDPLTAFFHFALYLAATVLLRMIMGLYVLPGMVAARPPGPVRIPGR
ncbi:MAG: hypothetical protein IT424_04270 [Pirellulales bacterium]|nr:hypothetical protein [Pirellulales bacterium]